MTAHDPTPESLTDRDTLDQAQARMTFVAPGL